MSDRICTYCGQSGHRAHGCPMRPLFTHLQDLHR